MSGRIAAAITLLAVSVRWPFVNSSLEGAVLWVVARGHGLTASDLLSPVGIAVAVVRLWFSRRPCASIRIPRNDNAAAPPLIGEP